MFAQPRTDIRDKLPAPALDYVTRIEYDFWYSLGCSPSLPGYCNTGALSYYFLNR